MFTKKKYAYVILIFSNYDILKGNLYSIWLVFFTMNCFFYLIYFYSSRYQIDNRVLIILEIYKI